MLGQTRVVLVAAVAISFVASDPARAQQHEHHAGMHDVGTRDSSATTATAATLPGQDAFGAIAEIVRILRADSATDWRRVDLESLRQHLVDMNAVTLESSVTAASVPNGLQMRITGPRRVSDALRRMVSAHNHVLSSEHLAGKAEEIDGGVLWTVTSPDSSRVAELRGLGFIGILALGNHHATHHLQLARGEAVAGHSH